MVLCCLLGCQDNNLCISLWSVWVKMLLRAVDMCG